MQLNLSRGGWGDRSPQALWPRPPCPHGLLSNPAPGNMTDTRHSGGLSLLYSTAIGLMMLLQNPRVAQNRSGRQEPGVAAEEEDAWRRRSSSSRCCVVVTAHLSAPRHYTRLKEKWDFSKSPRNIIQVRLNRRGMHGMHACIHHAFNEWTDMTNVAELEMQRFKINTCCHNYDVPNLIRNEKTFVCASL